MGGGGRGAIRKGLEGGGQTWSGYREGTRSVEGRLVLVVMVYG